MNRLLSLCTALCTALCFLAKSSCAQSLDSTLIFYSNRYPQEKIHIHFDKDAYLPGETIWMKAYLLSEAKPSSLSSKLYIDFTDADGKLLSHSISPIAEGSAGSSFKIPGWVRDGVVHVKAYTQWMLNFDEAFLYNKDIPVLMAADEMPQRPAKIITSLNFFPEGGDLIKGVTSVLAFEAMDQHNKPAKIRGVIRNSKNNIIDSFSTTYEGMGFVRFKPMAGEHYSTSWSDETGATYNTLLPDVKPNGLVLHVDPYANQKLHFRLEKSADASNLRKIILIGTINQDVVYRTSISLEKNRAEGNISAEGFPAGVMQISAFDLNMAPLAERVVFINNNTAYGTIQYKKLRVGLNKRARNEITIEIPDSLVTNLSVSVTDAGLGTDSSNNIFSDLLIAGDLKGTIPNPAGFLVNSDNTNINLNLLLLTHGWRRFKWESIVSGKLPALKYPQEDNLLSVRGEVKFSTGLDAHDTVALLLISRDRKKRVMKLPVDSRGKFGQGGLFFYDSVQIVYKFNNLSKLNSNGQIFLNSDLLPAFTPAKADDPSFDWVKVPEVVLEKEMNGNIIETRDNSTPSKSMAYVLGPKADSMGKNSESAAHYLADNFADLRFSHSLQENVSSGEVRQVSFNRVSSSARSNVNVTIDGTLVAMDDLREVNMKEVLYIKFLPPTTEKNLPTLAITSRQAIEQADILGNKTGFAVITGYTPVREFYQPRYYSKVSDFKASDFRSTLYWNPSVRLDYSRRKIKCVFYNNDVSNKFRIVIEGINQDGKICRLEEIIK